jgi:hypothetical protein
MFSLRPATPATPRIRSRTGSSSVRARRSFPLRRRRSSHKTQGFPPVGSFNITELGDKPDKIGKDTNFRGLTIFNNVIYTSKGSGGNGVNTVYFIDTSGAADSNGNPHACPMGVGLPSSSATPPTTPIVYNAANPATKHEDILSVWGLVC